MLDSLLTPALGSVTLLAIYFLSQRFIAPTIDFRAWKQLAGLHCDRGLRLGGHAPFF